MFDSNAMVVRAQIPSRIVPLVRQARANGDELLIRGVLDGVALTARLRNLAGEASSGTGGIDGIFDVIGDTGPISQGRFLRLELTLPADDGLIALPHEAIYGADRVYVVDADSRMRGVAVTRVGEWIDDAGKTRVLVSATGLAEGARIVVTQLPNALDGLLVRAADGG
jgi:multidrug efflux pump subunit AcrA (membrane-fusion protein)